MEPVQSQFPSDPGFNVGRDLHRVELGFWDGAVFGPFRDSYHVVEQDWEKLNAVRDDAVGCKSVLEVNRQL